MRKALNENPVAQIGLLAVLGLAVALLLVTRMGGGAAQEASSPEPGSTGVAAEESATPPAESAPAAGAAPSVEAPGSGAGAQSSTPGRSSAAASYSFVPGEGLPEDVVVAYAQNQAVVLLVIRRGGIDDRAVKGAVEQLRSRPGTAVFVTGAGQISRYSRITEGVNVSQVPALIVIQPRGVTDDVPTASVRYGFRGAPSIVQAVEDSLYNGPRLPTYPE